MERVIDCYGLLFCFLVLEDLYSSWLSWKHLSEAFGNILDGLLLSLVFQRSAIIGIQVMLDSVLLTVLNLRKMEKSFGQSIL
jgi:hypothetical protein